MPRRSRFAIPALGLALAVGASGCSVAFAPGCGIGAVDPMSDGASRLSPSFQRHALTGQMAAYQLKAQAVGIQANRGFRKPGSVPVAQGPAAFCLR